MNNGAGNWDFIDEALQRRTHENRLRSLSAVTPRQGSVIIERDGQRLINFCSNDYLSLASHPKLIERSKEYADQYGVGSTASRLISGTYSIHDQLEQKLANAFNAEAALIFNSGFQANSTILQAITDRKSLILADKKSHNSLLQGSLSSRASFQRFNHNDTDHLATLLERAQDEGYNRVLIVTETVFSMDGDCCDLDAIIGLANDYNAMLFVDDAHAVGVWGEKGRGLAFGKPGIDITLGTFGKAFGAFGSFITCSAAMREFLINFCAGFIYTTALPPPVIGALDAAVDVIPGLEKQRARYHDRINHLHQQVQDTGYATGLSSTQIIPIIVGDEKETLELSDFLEDQGILATAIRPPTVPESGSRIRITLSMAHQDHHIDKLVSTLRRWNER